jgi:hypothetical protein
MPGKEMESDMTREADTSRLDRLANVIHWIQFIVVLSAGAAAGLFLAVGLFSDGREAKGILMVGLAAWPAGALSAVVLAGIAYIFSGQFRVLPTPYRGPQFVAFAAIPLLIFGVTKAFFPGEVVNDDDWSEYGTVVPPLEKYELDYSRKRLRDDRTEYIHNSTGSYLIIDVEPEGPDAIAATVVNGWFIATAHWEVECEPMSQVAQDVTCNSVGDEAYATLKLEKPAWGDYDFEWDFDSSGYRISENFYQWPLDKARQVDAAQISKGAERPNVADLKTAQEAFRFGEYSNIFNDDD